MAAAGAEYDKEEISRLESISIPTKIFPEFSACPIGIPIGQYRLALPFIYANIINKFKDRACIYVNEAFREHENITVNNLDIGFQINIKDISKPYTEKWKVRYMPKHPCKFHCFIFVVTSKKEIHSIAAIYNRRENILELLDNFDESDRYDFVNKTSIRAMKIIIMNITKFDLSDTPVKILTNRIVNYFGRSIERSVTATRYALKRDPRGYCASWSIWLLYSRLTHPDRDIDLVIEEATRDFVALGTLNLIRGFVKEGVKLWKEAGIDSFRGFDFDKEISGVSLSDSQKRKLNEVWEKIFPEEIEVAYDDSPAEVLILDSDIVLKLFEMTETDETILKFMEESGVDLELQVYYAIKFGRVSLLDSIIKGALIFPSFIERVIETQEYRDEDMEFILNSIGKVVDPISWRELSMILARKYSEDFMRPVIINFLKKYTGFIPSFVESIIKKGESSESLEELFPLISTWSLFNLFYRTFDKRVLKYLVSKGEWKTTESVKLINKGIDNPALKEILVDIIGMNPVKAEEMIERTKSVDLDNIDATTVKELIELGEWLDIYTSIIFEDLLHKLTTEEIVEFVRETGINFDELIEQYLEAEAERHEYYEADEQHDEEVKKVEKLKTLLSN